MKIEYIKLVCDALCHKVLHSLAKSISDYLISNFLPKERINIFEGAYIYQGARNVMQNSLNTSYFVNLFIEPCIILQHENY